MCFFLMVRRPPSSTQSRSSAASDVYKRQVVLGRVSARKGWREALDALALVVAGGYDVTLDWFCLLYTSPSPRDRTRSRMPSSA